MQPSAWAIKTRCRRGFLAVCLSPSSLVSRTKRKWAHELERENQGGRNDERMFGVPLPFDQSGGEKKNFQIYPFCCLTETVCFSYHYLLPKCSDPFGLLSIHL